VVGKQSRERETCCSNDSILELKRRKHLLCRTCTENEYTTTDGTLEVNIKSGGNVSRLSKPPSSISIMGH
jgi:hypothetical protein